MTNKLFAVATVFLLIAFAAAQSTTPNARPRASDLGLKVGILPAGPLDAITDVAGVEVALARERDDLFAARLRDLAERDELDERER